MTNAQSAALTRIARLCARRNDYSALRAYVEALQASPAHPTRQDDGIHAWSGPTRPVAQKAGFHVFGWRLW